jgi:hypothetical protein
MAGKNATNSKSMAKHYVAPSVTILLGVVTFMTAFSKASH